MRVREAFVNPNQGADWAKATAWGIGRLWFQWDDPSRDVSKRHSGHVGLKMDGASATVAQVMSQQLTNNGYGPTSSPASCGAMFDPEPFHPADVLQLLQTWRQLRASRYTIVTVAPWQGGLFTPELATQINGDPNLLVAVQLYMDYAGDQLYPAACDAVDELANLGNGCAISRQRLTAFLPVKKFAQVGVEIPYGWSGLLWTFDNLPPAPPAPL